ncbi:cadherin-like beta sandwich domain-containing protein [Clostridium sp. AM58-1XD]|uniref:cadherin-like beta sandwich domain-containing protein n=1 Tax=Clostridium sp. AM58-1XD TaxID=2292307 RepID=UPI000E4EDFB9|nr:cadherin-like beta sandwich domain-containing protein [Clostridium sp. AM58-1XD]RGY98695.1 hypothetical protein DXA13_10080 [Clostridium sp. AM58-1XD]
MGENTVTCRVTAEDGQTVKTYTIHVNKVEGGETAAVTAVGDLTAVINGEQYTVAEAFDMAALPEGFEQVSYSYKGNDVMAARGTEKDLLLLYLTDAQESGAFFIYNESADSWTPYTEISTTSKAIVILPVDKSVTIPEGFTEGIMNLENGKKASGWVPAGEENPKYWLFYGMNWNGDKALYRYDLEENTIQRYFQDPIGANGSITVEQYKEVTDAQQELLHKYDLRGIIILIMGIVIAVLLAVAAVLAGRSGKSVKKTDMAGRTRRRAIAEMAASEELESEVLSREEKKDGKAAKKAKGESRRSGQKEPAVQPQKKSVIPPVEEDDDFEVIDLDLDEEDEDEEFEFIDVDEDTRDK